MMNFRGIRAALALATVTVFSNVAHSESIVPQLDSGAFVNNYAVKVFYDSPELRTKILITFEPLEADKSKDYVVVEVGEEQHNKLLNLGLTVELDKAATESINSPSIINSRAQMYGDTTVADAENSYPKIPSFSCYRTVEGTFSTAEAIVAQNPSLASWSDVGDSWRKQAGLSGYDMKVLKLSNSAITGDKPALFMTSSIHAREYAPAEMATRFAEHLVGNYGVDADITWMLDHHEVHMMLIANPDGRKQAETGLLWRKNTNQNYCGASSNNRGADLNRNFSYQWDCCDGSSSNECNTTFHGSGPASEPETQTIEAYMTALFGDNRGPNVNDVASLDTQGVYLDIHSYSELILWPWGFTNNSAPNNMVTLGRKFAYSNGYKPQQSIGLYPTDGTTTSFAYGELGVASYTFELGTAFFQDCNTFENTIVPDNMPSLLFALKAVRAPYKLPLGPEVVNIDLDLGDSFAIPAGTVVELTADASDNRFNNSNGTEPSQDVVQAEYTIDTVPWESGATPIAMTAVDGNFNNANEAVSASIDTSGFSEGRHTIYVRAKDDDGNWGVMTAIFLNIDNDAVFPSIIFEDDFETNLGWSANPSNTDTATTGQWERANPQDTNTSGPKQLGTTVSGSNSLVTEGDAGTSVGTNDIDNGVTSIRSPDISIPNGGPYTLSFSYYMAHTDNSTAADFFRVTVVGETQSTVVYEELGAANNDNAVWEQFSGDLGAYAGQTIYLLLEAADAANGSIVEAAIDDLKIEGVISVVNQPPVLNPMLDQNNDAGDVISILVSASDADQDPIEYSATGLPNGVTINSVTGEISGTLSSDSAGTYNVTITANDGAASVSDDFTWVVSEVNVAPVLSNPGSQTSNENSAVSLQLSAVDANNTPLSYSATGLPAGLGISSTGLITGNLSFTSSGQYSVTATVSDGVLSDSATFVWSVINVNRAPVISSLENQSGVVGDDVSVTVFASDADNETLSFTASGLPNGLVIGSASGVIEGTLSAAGFFNVSVTVSDGIDATSTNLTWSVIMQNVAPVLSSIGDQSNDEGSNVSLALLASDANNDNLTFTVTGLPAGLSLNANTNIVSGTLDNASNGSYEVTVTASDGVLSDSETFTWVVDEVSEPPTQVDASIIYVISDLMMY